MKSKGEKEIYIYPSECQVQRRATRNKNEKFLERTTHKVKYKNLHIQILDALRNTFLEYITESRMYSVISKIGKPTSNKDFNKYAAPFINDAYEDFYKDLRQDMKFILLDKNATKYVKNVGSKPYNIFCKVINSFLTETN